MNVKDLIAAVHALFESRIIPPPFRYMLLTGLICLLFSLAGFPVAEYAEQMHRWLKLEQPKLYSAIVAMLAGAAIGSLASRTLKHVAMRIAVKQVGGRVEYTDTRPAGYETYVEDSRLREYRVKYVLNYWTAGLVLVLLCMVAYTLLVT